MMWTAKRGGLPTFGFSVDLPAFDHENILLAFGFKKSTLKYISFFGMIQRILKDMSIITRGRSFDIYAGTQPFTVHEGCCLLYIVIYGDSQITVTS